MSIVRLKEIVKGIDGRFLNGFLMSLYVFYLTSRITPLPSYFKSIFSLSARKAFFDQAQYYLQVNRIDGVYAEFGCHEVNTFRMALRTIGLPGRPNEITHFYAFDSFEGMPEPTGIDRQKIWRKSMNFTS